MSFQHIRRTLTFALALCAPAAMAAPVWQSDFEQGGASEWTKQQVVSPDRAQVVPAPGGRAGNALQVTVHQGDDPINSGNDRAELVQMTMEPEGSEYVYKWSVMFAEDYPSSDKWQLFTQWHQEQLAGTPPLEMYVVGEEMRLRPGGHDGPVVWTAPLQRGVWHDFILRVKWSADPSVGFVELYHNGTLALPATPAATQLPGQKNYLKMGLYRSGDIAQTGVVYFDDVVMAESLAGVMPAANAQAAADDELMTAPVGSLTDADADGYEYGEAVTPEEMSSCTGSSTGSVAPVAGALLLLTGLAVFRRRTPKLAKVAVRS